MTTEVMITHMQPLYDKSVMIEIVDDEGHLVPGTAEIELKPGAFHRVYLYQGQNVHLREMPGKLTS